MTSIRTFFFPRSSFAKYRTFSTVLQKSQINVFRFGGIYSIDSRIITGSIRGVPNLLTKEILNDPKLLHQFLLRVQIKLLQDKNSVQHFVVPLRDPESVNESNLKKSTTAEIEVYKGVHYGGLQTNQLATKFAANISDIIDTRLWNKEDRWKDKINRSQRITTFQNLSVDEIKLFDAIEMNKTEDEIIKLIEEKNINLNVKKPPTGITPLHVACQYGNKIAIELILKYGADVNIKSLNGSTPLHWSCSSGDLEIVKLLVQYGADVNATTNSWLTDSVYGKSSGQTPLHWASENNKIEVVLYLLQQGSIPSAQDERGSTPFDISDSNNIKNLLSDYNNTKYLCFQFDSSSIGYASEFSQLLSLWEKISN